MKILLTNDDGIHGEGIHALASALKEAGHEILIVAPMENNSAVSHKLTRHTLIPIEKRTEYSYAVGGTPTDCVLVALNYLKFTPDLVLSGINRGMNAGSDVLYSGTVAGAMEGAQNGIPSIALSQCLYKNTQEEINAYFCRAAKLTAENLTAWVKLARETDVLNVNFPRGEIKDIRFCRQVRSTYTVCYVEEEGGLCLDAISENSTQDGDFTAVLDGYITITPLNLNLTDDDAMRRWRNGA